jgi:hypothetical protein
MERIARRERSEAARPNYLFLKKNSMQNEEEVIGNIAYTLGMEIWNLKRSLANSERTANRLKDINKTQKEDIDKLRKLVNNLKRIKNVSSIKTSNPRK